MKAIEIGHRRLALAAMGLLALNVQGCGGSSTAGAVANPTYTVGGSVAGLSSGMSVVLRDNGGDSLPVSSNGAFTFATPIAIGGSYQVTVATQPTGATCTVSGDSGAVAGADISTVDVQCVLNTYTIGGTVSGLAPGKALVALQNGGTIGSLSIRSNGNFSFLTPMVFGTSYNVTVSTQPSGQNCVVSAGSGTVPASDVTNVIVHCPLVQTLWKFGSNPNVMDGGRPNGGLIQGTNSNFYGTTYQGGMVSLAGGGYGGGTVFKVTPLGVETLLWSFGAGSDGQNPAAGVIQGSDGNFYGTTYSGGTHGLGTVFRVTPAGSETVLWNFGAGQDGQNPFGGVIQGSDGNFYGTTVNGGTNGAGITYKVSAAGVETVLWNFGSGNDGQQPFGNLIEASDGNFYGVTESGGVQGVGTGTVFKLTPAGVESVLWNFGTGTDGRVPVALIQANDGNFYGTTLSAGPGSGGPGIVFMVTPAGVESVLWDFTGPQDGAQPYGGVIQGQDGYLYGTTYMGGALAFGTLYRISLVGTETVLWGFDDSDGQNPTGGLVQGSDGNFYGTDLVRVFKLIP